MTIGMMLRAGIFGIACATATAFAVWPATAEEAQDSNTSSSAPATTARKAKAKHSEHKAKESTSESRPKRGEFKSEADAKAHCKGTVVWVDSDHFNHYAGSREYGREPGAFACENG